MFDGMRAYHQSEIAHKKDAIDILKSILTTTILIDGALISTIISKNVGSVALTAVFVTVFIIAAAVAVIIFFMSKKWIRTIIGIKNIAMNTY